MSEPLPDSSTDIEQAQLRGFARSIAGVEWLMLALVGLYLLVDPPIAANRAALIGSLAAYAAILVISRVLPRLRTNAQLRLATEIFAMVAFLTAVLSQIGAETSPLLNLYLLPVIAAALVLGRRATILVTVLVCLCYFLLIYTLRGLEATSPVQIIRAATLLVPFLLVAFMTSLLARDIQLAQRRIRALSDRDVLTGLLNIRAFMRRAKRTHDKARQVDGTYSILMVDIDRLKQINETYGHEAGNKALRTVANSLLRVTGPQDVVARFSGEEFVACLAEREIVGADEVAQRLRNLVYASTLEVNVDIVRIQVSVGVANFPVDGDGLERVMSAAERAMYKDKQLRAQPEGALVIQKR